MQEILKHKTQYFYDINTSSHSLTLKFQGSYIGSQADFTSLLVEMVDDKPFHFTAKYDDHENEIIIIPQNNTFNSIYVNCAAGNQQELKELIKSTVKERYSQKQTIQAEIIDPTKDVEFEESATAEEMLDTIMSNVNQISDQINVDTLKSQSDSIDALLNEAYSAISVKEHIDNIFAVMSGEKEKLLEAGDKAQGMLAALYKQKEAMGKVYEKAEEEKAMLEEQNGYIPLSKQSAYNTISQQVEIINNKLARTHALVSLITAREIEITKVLPMMKSLLADEASFSSLLDSVEESSSLADKLSSTLLSISDNNSKVLHNKVGNLLDKQIQNDTLERMIDTNHANAQEFNLMLGEKSAQISDKMTALTSKINQLKIESTTSATVQQLEQLNS